MLDKDYFVKCLKLLCTSFDKEFSEQQMIAYYSILKDLSEVQMQYATKRIMEEDKYFPRISNFYDKLKQLEVSNESKADEFIGHARALLGMYGAEALLEIFGNGTFPLKDPKRFCDPIAYEIVKRNLDRLRNHDIKDDMALNSQLKKMYISECEYQKTTKVKEENPQLVFNEKIKELSGTLKLN